MHQQSAALFQILRAAVRGDEFHHRATVRQLRQQQRHLLSVAEGILRKAERICERLMQRVDFSSPLLHHRFKLRLHKRRHRVQCMQMPLPCAHSDLLHPVCKACLLRLLRRRE